jgi:hypothetical protein
MLAGGALAARSVLRAVFIARWEGRLGRGRAARDVGIDGDYISHQHIDVNGIYL